MRDELEIIEQRDVWEIVDKPQNKNIIPSRWVFTIKRDPNGDIIKFKARLVAGGHRQKYGVDYKEIYSPVVDFSVIRYCFSYFVAYLKWTHRQIDVKGAYLYGKLYHEIYMRQPPGFETDGKVALLKKSLYGLHQSGLEWFRELNKIVTELGFESLPHIKCGFKWNDIAVILVYVDDMTIFAIDQITAEKVINKIKEKLEITELGPIRKFLGVNFVDANGSYGVHQRDYIDSLYPNIPFVFTNLPIVINENDNSEREDIYEENSEYRKVVGSLMYLMTKTRPDIAFALNYFSQRCEKHSKQDWEGLCRLLNYVRSTKDKILNLKSDENVFYLYTDASLGPKFSARHSISGHMILFGKSVVSWKTEKQKSVSIGSAEAEYIALSEAIRELVWFRNIVLDFKFVAEPPFKIFCDNLSAISFAENEISNKRAKYIDIRYHHIRSVLKELNWNISYVKSNENWADYMTKQYSLQRRNNLFDLLFPVNKGAIC